MIFCGGGWAVTINSCCYVSFTDCFYIFIRTLLIGGQPAWRGAGHAPGAAGAGLQAVGVSVWRPALARLCHDAAREMLGLCPNGGRYAGPNSSALPPLPYIASRICVSQNSSPTLLPSVASHLRPILIGVELEKYKYIYSYIILYII